MKIMFLSTTRPKTSHLRPAKTNNRMTLTKILSKRLAYDFMGWLNFVSMGHLSIKQFCNSVVWLIWHKNEYVYQSAFLLEDVAQFYSTCFTGMGSCIWTPDSQWNKSFFFSFFLSDFKWLRHSNEPRKVPHEVILVIAIRDIGYDWDFPLCKPL